MFPTSIYTHQLLHKARQRELEADVQANRLVCATRQAGLISFIRQRIGMSLIALGKKVAQEPQYDVRLLLSARR